MKYIPNINIDKCLEVRPVYFWGGRGATNEYFRPKESIIFPL